MLCGAVKGEEEMLLISIGFAREGVSFSGGMWKIWWIKMNLAVL
jgi:hypothetical protein